MKGRRGKHSTRKEKGIKSLLSCLLIGPAFEVYVDNREKSLKEIMQILTDRFGEMLTITDKIKALKFGEIL